MLGAWESNSLDSVEMAIVVRVEGVEDGLHARLDLVVAPEALAQRLDAACHTLLSCGARAAVPALARCPAAEDGPRSSRKL